MIVIIPLDWKVSVDRGSTETWEEFCEELEAGLTARDVAYNEPKQSNNLQINHDGYWNNDCKYCQLPGGQLQSAWG